MQNRSSELLAGFEVFTNWRERAAAYERLARVAFAVTLGAVFALTTLLGIYRLFVEWVPVRLIFTSEAVWIILLAIGGWALTRTPVQELTGHLSIAIVSVLLLLITVIVAPWLQTDLRLSSPPNWLYVIASLVPVLTAVIGTALLTYRRCRASPFCRVFSSWRLQATFFGTIAGILLLFQQLLAVVFADVALHSFEYRPLLHLQWFVVVMFVQVPAEEFLFRSVVFDYLHKIRGQSLWLAIAITVLVNLLIYLPLTPSDLSPGQLTIYLLQPTMVAITCSLLWSWERGINACLACNITFRLLLMLLW